MTTIPTNQWARTYQIEVAAAAATKAAAPSPVSRHAGLQWHAALAPQAAATAAYWLGNSIGY